MPVGDCCCRVDADFLLLLMWIVAMPALILFFAFLFVVPSSYAVTVVGVIAGHNEGIALVRTKIGASTRAVKSGETLEPGVTVARISREYVDLRVQGKIQRMRVGEETAIDYSPSSMADSGSSQFTEHRFAQGGIERNGNEVRITSELRDLVVRRELAKVLMQAAAIPYYIQGELRGFKLWDIDAGSLYELVGFKNGDIVTALNGSEIVDVGSTVRLLHSLRDANEATVSVLRNGFEQTIKIAIN